MKPVQIDVFYPVPEGWGICTACEVMMSQANLGQAPPERGLDEYPPEWQEELKRLSTTIYDLADRYQDEIRIRIWDPRSLQGLWRSIRHGVRRYPTFLIDGRSKMTGWDTAQLVQQIRAAVEFNKTAL
jgi:hypothetical protein